MLSIIINDKVNEFGYLFFIFICKNTIITLIHIIKFKNCNIGHLKYKIYHPKCTVTSEDTK